MNRFVFAALAAMVATPAFAHAHLLSETPPAQAMLGTSPTMLMLTFSEGVELKFTGVKVTGPAGATVALGAASLDPQHNTILMVPLTGRLPAGLYTVAWHALATDGHKTQGSYGFTVR